MSIFDSQNSAPQIVSFNSKDRASGTNSDFLSAPVDIGLNRFDSVALLQASIPKSYYNMPSGYNTFTLTEKAVSTTDIKFNLSSDVLNFNLFSFRDSVRLFFTSIKELTSIFSLFSVKNLYSSEYCFRSIINLVLLSVKLLYSILIMFNFSL